MSTSEPMSGPRQPPDSQPGASDVPAQEDPPTPPTGPTPWPGAPPQGPPGTPPGPGPDTPMAPPLPEALAAPKQKRTWRTWQAATGTGVALLIGVGIGGVSGNQTAQDAESERDEARAAMEAAEERANAETARVDGLESAVFEAEQRANAAEEVARQEVEAELAPRVAEMDTRQAQLDAQAADLATREAALNATLAGLQASQFGDGVFQVGRDIQPGTYSNAPGVADCYYAELAADGADILDNNIVNGPATVIIDSPFFESSGCGTWTKVG